MTYGRPCADSPGRRLQALYAGAPVTTRAHVAVRWATCPFPAIAAQIPLAGRVLEVGCGHGLLSLYLALTAPELAVHGIDVDDAKLAQAQEAATRAALACSFERVKADHLPEGPWDAIAIVDVLYLLPAADQVGLLARCAEALAPGGTLVVKEMALSPRWKAGWNSAQETAAVRILRITEGSELTFLPPAELAATMAGAGLEVHHRPLHRGYLHPHHLLVGRRPQ